MSTNLDQLYSPGSGLVDKVDALSRNTVKNNIQNQRIPQQQITQAPSNDEHILRKYDMDYRYVRVVNQSGSMNANTRLQWTVNSLEDNRIHNFIIKVAVGGVDYLFNWACYITSKSYKNMGPIFQFGHAENFNETAKIKCWVQDGKINIISTVAPASVAVYLYKEKNL